MPSGHTAYTAMLFMLVPLAAINPRLRGKESALSVLAIAATLVTALARISDGHHYLTDVAAAMLIAVAVQAATIFAMYGKRADALEFKRFLRPKTEAAA